MAKVCDICGRGVLVGNTVSHANNRNKKRSYLNLKRVKVKLEKGGAKYIKACTRCLRSGKVIKAA